MEDQFKLILTADGSVSLQNLRTGEPMHSLQGALAESLYIYQEALKRCLSLIRNRPVILSLGLGLAYNEIISIAHLHQFQIHNFKMVSYEKNQGLLQALQQWLGLLEKPVRKHHWFSAYDSILKRVAMRFHLEEGPLKQQLKDSIRSQKWIFQGPLTSSTQFPEKFNCIFYDAFSEKTDPELWTSPHLETWLSRACQENCIVSTYAAKGCLNRVLKNQGFKLIKRSGFSGKKQSTLAIKGCE